MIVSITLIIDRIAAAMVGADSTHNLPDETERASGAGSRVNPTPRPQRGRRAPAPQDRQRDAERSRELLLQAALEEFAAKGFSGARVQDIATRAGVNKQLISYYFGGKEGLYQAIQDRWFESEASFANPELPLDALL